MLKVHEYQIGASFIAIGIYLELSNKWIKECALQYWFFWQWMIGNKMFEKIMWHYALLIQRKKSYNSDTYISGKKLFEWSI